MYLIIICFGQSKYVKWFWVYVRLFGNNENIDVYEFSGQLAPRFNSNGLERNGQTFGEISVFAVLTQDKEDDECVFHLCQR